MAKTESVSAPVTLTTWAIANLERETADGKVIVAHYTVNANNGTYSAGAYGSLGFDGEVTTPFAELTEEQVVSWVKEALGEDKVAEVEAALQNQIDEQAAPTKAAGTPW
jgi:hypothetical protein